MNEATVTPWPRPYWSAGGGDATLLYFIFGRFDDELHIPAARHGSRGLPQGVTLYRHPHEALRAWAGYPLGGALGELLRQDDARIFDAAAAAPDVLSVRGEVADPPSLDYLRDSIGVLAALLDAGGVAVADPQILALFDADGWRRRFLVDGGAPPRNHVLILCNPDGGRRQWVHSRGMRKFARPDISIRDVPPDEVARAGALCERLVEMQALGAQLHAEQPLEVDGFDDLLVVRPGGGMDDPHFNNSHVEIRWPR